MIDFSKPKKHSSIPVISYVWIGLGLAGVALLSMPPSSSGGGWVLFCFFVLAYLASISDAARRTAAATEYLAAQAVPPPPRAETDVELQAKREAAKRARIMPSDQAAKQ
jgi:hypothetical protein